MKNSPDTRPTNSQEDPAALFIALREQVVRRLEILAEALQARSETLELSLVPRMSRGTESR